MGMVRITSGGVRNRHGSRNRILMNVFLWLVQIMCAGMFLGYGLRKVTIPRERLRKRTSWVGDFPHPFVIFIGSVEILGSMALILPGMFRRATLLTPIAAVALAVLMVLGAALHTRRGEYREMLTQEPWFFAAFVFIAWARFGPYPL